MPVKDYVSTKEQAKWIRGALKVAFPGVKFSVRSSSGSAVRVDWTDGPTSKAVCEVTRRFTMEGFDGMTDMRYNVPLSIDGREVYGGGLILEQRNISDEFRAEILDEFERISGHSIPRDYDHYWGTRLPLWVDREGVIHRMVDSDVQYVNDLVHRVTATRSR